MLGVDIIIGVGEEVVHNTNKYNITLKSRSDILAPRPWSNLLYKFIAKDVLIDLLVANVFNAGKKYIPKLWLLDLAWFEVSRDNPQS